ncbi:hypothetical protein EH165_08660 [Nakamurella antarctica]|uniref:Uncharacterized protein n=1 Tax=Nakamurella antarctica TaxID=1902245 RepID=A0A3G8ZN16_9ACTN|nr:hypothetical protein [Nakamurella antarctica]AZI58197.1 hypothetical protein EH165_08660 [Nakamurella antarctica]
MSKVDALRALREARYSASPSKSTLFDPAGTAGAGSKRQPATKSVVTRKAAAAASASVDSVLPHAPAADVDEGAASPQPGQSARQEGAAQAAEEALCGHRSMGNKSCSRPSGHPEKNHRYK